MPFARLPRDDIREEKNVDKSLSQVSTQIDESCRRIQKKLEELDKKLSGDAMFNIKLLVGVHISCAAFILGVGTLVSKLYLH